MSDGEGCKASDVAGHSQQQAALQVKLDPHYAHSVANEERREASQRDAVAIADARADLASAVAPSYSMGGSATASGDTVTNCAKCCRPHAAEPPSRWCVRELRAFLEKNGVKHGQQINDKSELIEAVSLLWKAFNHDGMLPTHGPLAGVPRKLVPDDEELRRLYAHVAFSEQKVRAAASRTAAPNKPQGSAPATQWQLWIAVMQHLYQRHGGPNMSDAILQQFFCFFFALLPRTHDNEDGAAIKKELRWCVMCLRDVCANPKLQLQIAGSHWISRGVWKFIGNPLEKSDSAPMIHFSHTTALTSIGGAHLHLFCTIPEAKEDDTRHRCEHTLSENGETPGIPQLTKAIKTVAASGSAAVDLVFTPALRYLLVTLAYRCMLAAPDNALASSAWMSPKGPFPDEDVRQRMWRFFFALRRHCAERMPGTEAANAEPDFSVHMMANDIARENIQQFENTGLLHLETYSHYAELHSSRQTCYWYCAIHGFHFLVCWPPINPQHQMFTTFDGLKGTPFGGFHAVLSPHGPTNVRVPAGPLELPQAVVIIYDRSLSLKRDEEEILPGAAGSNGQRVQRPCDVISDLSNVKIFRSQLPTLLLGLPSQIMFADAFPHSPSIGSRECNVGELRFPSKTYEMMWQGNTVQYQEKWSRFLDCSVEHVTFLRHRHQPKRVAIHNFVDRKSDQRSVLAIQYGDVDFAEVIRLATTHAKNPAALVQALQLTTMPQADWTTRFKTDIGQQFGITGLLSSFVAASKRALADPIPTTTDGTSGVTKALRKAKPPKQEHAAAAAAPVATAAIAAAASAAAPVSGPLPFDPDSTAPIDDGLQQAILQSFVL